MPENLGYKGTVAFLKQNERRKCHPRFLWKQLARDFKPLIQLKDGSYQRAILDSAAENRNSMRTNQPAPEHGIDPPHLL
ncbi:MAG: hypothetical protein ACK56F_21920, partial [bacterium]